MHLVAEHGQEALVKLAHVATAVRICTSGTIGHGLTPPPARQSEHNLRSRAAFPGSNRAVMALDNPFGNRQPQPGALRLRRREWLEQFVMHFRRPSRAIVP